MLAVFRFYTDDDTSGRETGMDQTNIRLTGKHPICLGVLYLAVFVDGAWLQNVFCSA